MFDEMVKNILLDKVFFWFYEVKYGDIIWMGCCDFEGWMVSYI